MAAGRCADGGVATARSGQLPETAAALWRGGFCERVELAGLSLDSVAQLLEAVLQGPVGLNVAERFARRSQGNPLLLRELVQAALTRSALVERDGVWVLDGEAPVSGGVRDLVAERLGDLDDDARTGLEAIAAGEPLPARRGARRRRRAGARPPRAGPAGDGDDGAGRPRRCTPHTRSTAR